MYYVLLYIIGLRLKIAHISLNYTTSPPAAALVLVRALDKPPPSAYTLRSQTNTGLAMNTYNFPTIEGLRKALSVRDARVRKSRLGDDWVGG